MVCCLFWVAFVLGCLVVVVWVVVVVAVGIYLAVAMLATPSCLLLLHVALVMATGELLAKCANIFIQARQRS